MINGVIDVINEIPGVSLGKIGTLSLPRLAKGGVLKEGTAMVAEAGPELLSMVNGKAVVTPLSGSAKNQAMENAGKGGGGYVQNVNITSPKALSPYGMTFSVAATVKRICIQALACTPSLAAAIGPAACIAVRGPSVAALARGT